MRLLIVAILLITSFVHLENPSEQYQDQETIQYSITQEEYTSFGKLPINNTVSLLYSSGAGAWGSWIFLEPDGSFTGSYHDSEMGDVGEDYPRGTVYVYEYSGKFSDIKKVDDYTYTMTLSQYQSEMEYNEWEEWIEDGTRYIVSDSFGFINNIGTEYTFILPGKPVSELPESVFYWKGFSEFKNETVLDYGLYNDCIPGFFSQWSEISGFYTLTNDDFVINIDGVSISEIMPPKEIVDNFDVETITQSKTSLYVDTESKANLNDVFVYDSKTPSFSAICHSNRQTVRPTINYIRIYDINIETARGISIGDNLSDVISKYGEKYIRKASPNGDTGCIYYLYSPYEYIVFSYFEKDVVSGIDIVFSDMWVVPTQT